MPARLLLAVLGLLLLAPLSHAGGFFLDPVTTFTNGMPLPTTTTLRSHMFNYQCDPYHIGCCNGRYNHACLRSIFHPNHCCNRPWTEPSAPCRPIGGSMEGIESDEVEILGQLPAPATALGLPAP